MVIVTVLDEDAFSHSYMKSVKDNRIKYAEKHGMAYPFARYRHHRVGWS